MACLDTNCGVSFSSLFSTMSCCNLKSAMCPFERKRTLLSGERKYGVRCIRQGLPLAVRRVAEMASATARDNRDDRLKLTGMSRAQKVLPCPATEFNAAGLLYFPSYSALADRGLSQAGEKHIGMITSRNVLYLGNVEPGEWIDITFKTLPSGHDVLLKGRDSRPLALMRVRFNRSNNSSATA